MTYIEQELKLMLTARQYNLLLTKDASTVVQYNHYFFCDNMDTSTVIRIRQKQDNYQLTCKQGVTSVNNISVAKEYNMDITANLAQSMIANGITKEQLKDILDISMPHDCRYIGVLKTTRSVVLIEGMSVELDCNQYLGTTDYELEYECNDIVTIDRLKSILLYKYGIIAVSSKPKSRRFVEKLAGIPMPL